MALSSVGLTAVAGAGGAGRFPRWWPHSLCSMRCWGRCTNALREIGIYSSVGLAPLHIALLFVAEACVYAVLGDDVGLFAGSGVGEGAIVNGAVCRALP